MLNLTRVVRTAEPAHATITLSFDVRQKSRFRAQLDDGRDAFVQLPRGSVLRHGDILESAVESGASVRVQVLAALELVSVATSADPLLLMRAVYHLGNRHVPLDIQQHRLLYHHDHVLDAMLRELGVHVQSSRLPFHPEAGAHSHERHAHSHERHGDAS